MRALHFFCPSLILHSRFRLIGEDQRSNTLKAPPKSRQILSFSWARRLASAQLNTFEPQESVQEGAAGLASRNLAPWAPDQALRVLWAPASLSIAEHRRCRFCLPLHIIPVTWLRPHRLPLYAPHMYGLGLISTRLSPQRPFDMQGRASPSQANAIEVLGKPDRDRHKMRRLPEKKKGGSGSCLCIPKKKCPSRLARLSSALECRYREPCSTRFMSLRCVLWAHNPRGSP